MNKQEINEKLKENGAWCTECHTWVTDRYVKIRKALELVGQLDEPQKPVVPKFLDEYIKDNEGQHAADIFSAEWLYEESGVLEEKVAEWLLDDEVEENNRRYLIAVQAFVTGDYEVEKEPLYRVKIGEGYFVEYQGRGALIMPDCNKEIKIFDSKSDAERTAQTIGGTVEEVAE